MPDARAYITCAAYGEDHCGETVTICGLTDPSHERISAELEARLVALGWQVERPLFDDGDIGEFPICPKHPDDRRERWAWCFSHGAVHYFGADQGPWCTATWVWLNGATEAEALADKGARFGDARFLDQLPNEQQLAIINGDVAGRKTEVDRD